MILQKAVRKDVLCLFETQNTASATSCKKGKNQLLVVGVVGLTHFQWSMIERGIHPLMK